MYSRMKFASVLPRKTASLGVGLVRTPWKAPSWASRWNVRPMPRSPPKTRVIQMSPAAMSWGRTMVASIEKLKSTPASTANAAMAAMRSLVRNSSSRSFQMMA